jgi:hypothetical protein
MNKYLLLRDNKQSGPYTVPELAEKGIKPYDLVWLDGKSIAWRYPGEIEELKPYAPLVEEQPFDRFYKKPESITKAAPATCTVQHSVYEPKIETQETDSSIPQKKVYINFPVGNAPQQKIVAEKKITFHEPVPEPVTSPTFAEKTNYIQPAERVSYKKNEQQTNKKFIYYAVAAAAILIGFVTVLLINNNQQQQRLKELNTIVKEIESKKANDIATQTTQVKNTVPSPEPVQPQTSETIVNPELLANNDYSKPAPKESVPQSEAAVTVPKKVVQPAESSSGVTFKERPVLRRTDNEPAAVPVTQNNEPAPASENIYKQVSVKPNNYKTGVLGGISNLQFEITNNSKRELQKVAIEIKYLGPEKKVVNTQTVYIENVSAGGHATIDVPKSKRGVSINYTITDIKS